MTPEEIIEGNKLIARFMGYEYYPYSKGETLPGWRKEKANRKISGNYLVRTHRDLPYHRSYEHIMSVVEKIESMDLKNQMYSWEEFWGDEPGTEPKTRYNFEGLSVEIENNTCMIYANLALDPFWIINEKTLKEKHPTKKEAIFKSVVEFIEWFNVWSNANK